MSQACTVSANLLNNVTVKTIWDGKNNEIFLYDVIGEYSWQLFPD